AARWRWSDAEADVTHALLLDPKYPAAHEGYGELLLIQNRVPQALEHLRRAAELDAASPFIASSLSLALAISGKDTAAMTQARRAVDLDATLYAPHFIWGLDHLAARRSAVAAQQLEIALGLHKGMARGQGALAYAYATSGQ